MQKRLLLAVFLSFIVLYIWAGVARPPQQSENSLELSQHIENKEDIKVTTSLSPTPKILVATQETLEKEENIETIENDKLIIKFSNIGGKIKGVTLKDYDVSLPVESLGTLSEYENAEFYLERSGPRLIVYSYEDEDFKVTNSYKVSDDYIIEVNNRLYNNSEMSKLINVRVNGISLEMSSLKDKDNYASKRDRALNEYAVYTYSGIHRKSNAFKFSQKELKKEESTHVEWVAFRNRYFCAILKPEFETEGYKIDPVSEERLNIEIYAKDVNVPKGGGRPIYRPLFLSDPKD